jgi:hypothetical protein
MSVSSEVLSVNDIFIRSVKSLKEFPKYKHLLFSTGMEDNINYDMNDDSSFSIDSNMAEFTSDALRLAIMYYLYNNPEVKFDTQLLTLEQNLFSFDSGIYHPQLIESIKKSIDCGEQFIFPFLPITGSSHWYTLCIQPLTRRIIIINPLSKSEKKDQNYFYKIMFMLCEKLDVRYNTCFEFANIQTSDRSCGESTLLIFLAMLTARDHGYLNLIKHLHKDSHIDSINDIKLIALGQFCKCNKCIGINLPFRELKQYYNFCKNCKELNYITNITKCVHCSNEFNHGTCKTIFYTTTKNRKRVEQNIRQEILDIVETEKLSMCKKQTV